MEQKSYSFANQRLLFPLPVKPIQYQKGGVTAVKLVKNQKQDKQKVCRFAVKS